MVCGWVEQGSEIVKDGNSQGMSLRHGFKSGPSTMLQLV